MVDSSLSVPRVWGSLPRHRTMSRVHWSVIDREIWSNAARSLMVAYVNATIALNSIFGYAQGIAL